jgi:hypothetical protein
MNIKETLIVLRNIHFKCFFIGIFFLILAALIYLPCNCYVANIYQTSFGITAESYYNMWAIFIGLIKMILIFFFLVPALAIHWVAKGYKEKTEEENN